MIRRSFIFLNTLLITIEILFPNALEISNLGKFVYHLSHASKSRVYHSDVEIERISTRLETVPELFDLCQNCGSETGKRPD